MINASQAKELTSDDKIQQIRESFERSIKRAAEYGNHYCYLTCCDCATGDTRIVLDELQRNGFKIYRHREMSSGVLQAEAYYARW